MITWKKFSDELPPENTCVFTRELDKEDQEYWYGT